MVLTDQDRARDAEELRIVVEAVERGVASTELFESAMMAALDKEWMAKELGKLPRPETYTQRIERMIREEKAAAGVKEPEQDG